MDASAPLLGFIGRLDAQKGVDLIGDSYEWLMAQASSRGLPCYFAVLMQHGIAMWGLPQRFPAPRPCSEAGL